MNKTEERVVSSIRSSGSAGAPAAPAEAEPKK